MVSAAGSLQPRGHFAGLSGIYATVIFAGGEEDGRIVCSVFDMMVRRVGVQGFKLRRVFYCSEFRNVELAVRIKLNAEHIVDADARDDGAEKVRTLGKGGAHE